MLIYRTKLMSTMVKNFLTNVDSFDTNGRAKTNWYGQLCEQEQEQAQIAEALTALARIANPEAIYYLELSDKSTIENSAGKRLEGANHGTY